MATQHWISSFGVGGLALALAASCMTQEMGSQSVDVSHQNELGVMALETAHVETQGNSIYTLRALSADDQELASVRLTTGTIADLSAKLPGDDHGSEIVVAVADVTTRLITRETRLFHLPSSQPAIARLLAIPEVSSTLLHDANIVAVTPSAATENPYYQADCNPSLLLTTPVAEQCCYSDGGEGDGAGFYTLFIRGSDNEFIYRYRNPYETGCTAADGVSGCNGTDCYYGPFGFSRPELDGSNSNPIVAYHHAILDGDMPESWCEPQVGGARYYADQANGTNPTGAGCPGGDEGYGDWDY